MSITFFRCLTISAICASLIAVTAHAQGVKGVTKTKQGEGGSVVQGAAGTDGSAGDTGLEHCEKPMGAMAVVEPQNEVLVALSRYKLSSPVGLIRLMIQQSNCFIVVERGAGMQNLMQERQLAAAGQARQNSNIGGGQMVAADFVLTPGVVFSDGNAGGVGGSVGGILGRRIPLVGGVAGGLKVQEAQTSMLVADARSGVQVAAAEGSTKKADFRLGASVLGGVSAGGYGSTDQGKIIAAALMDNYNNVVGVVRNDASLQRNVGSLKQEATAGGATKAGAVFSEGDVLGPKIANVRLLAEPTDTGKVLATLGKADEVVVIGSEKDGFINVQGPTATGWVKITLVQKH